MAELMKGHVWSERKHTLAYPAVAEIKYDEIRCHVKRFPPANGIIEHVEFLSYAGKPLSNLWPWADTFLDWMRDNGLMNLDIGVEVNGNFNDSYRWVRSSSGVPRYKKDKKTGKEYPALAASMVRFILFDMPDLGSLKFHARRAHRAGACIDLANAGLPISCPEYRVCENEVEVDAYFVEVRERGFEGLMVKSLDHLYHSVPERTDGWLKMKPEETFDGKIIAVNQAFATDGTPHDRAGSVDVVLEDGSRASPSGIEWGLARAMWAHPERYIGRWIEFKAMERDRQGGYRHPSYVRFREDKA